MNDATRDAIMLRWFREPDLDRVNWSDRDLVVDRGMALSNFETLNREPLRTPLCGLSDEMVFQMLDATGTYLGGPAFSCGPLISEFSLPGAVRRVKVTVTKYMMGQHHWVRVVEDDDYYWDWDMGTWRRPWSGYDELRGRTFEGHFTRPVDVQPFLDVVLERFAGPGYEITYESHGSSVYAREGD